MLVSLARLYAWIVAAAFLAGAACEVGDLTPELGVEIHDSPWPLEEVDTVLLVLADLFPGDPERSRDRLSHLRVRCHPGETIEAEWTDDPVYGVNRRRHEIEIGCGFEHIEDSALAHEAAHDLSREYFFHPDAEHGHCRVWGAVEQTRALIRGDVP